MIYVSKPPISNKAGIQRDLFMKNPIEGSERINNSYNKESSSPSKHKGIKSLLENSPDRAIVVKEKSISPVSQEFSNKKIPEKKEFFEKQKKEEKNGG